jgi:sigma54-dependent transcription regulator
MQLWPRLHLMTARSSRFWSSRIFPGQSYSRKASFSGVWNVPNVLIHAVPAGLLESELFGQERGAFNGAIAQTTGRFHQANQGTLFLGEIGKPPLELQPKLMRVMYCSRPPKFTFRC